MELAKPKRGRQDDHGHGDAKRLAVVPHPSSRIYRFSRGSVGKDRHSKVYTAKGIRDRRVRLSVATAIHFYDLQDRLGYHQPSKAVDWLIKAAAAAIDRLPELELDAAAFPNHPASANKSSALLHAASPSQLQQQLTRSACSNTSETSKGSVLSLSRSDSRVTARDKDNEAGDDSATAAAATSTQAASFTELLTWLTVATATPATPAAVVAEHNSWQQMTASATADYLGFTQPRKFSSPAPHLAPGQHFSLSGSGGGDSQTAEMLHLSFLQDHYTSVHPAPDYTLNFSMSSALVGVTNGRGALQSNSHPHFSNHHHHHHHHPQRMSTPLDAPHIQLFLFSPAAAVASPATAESHLAAAAALQLWDGFRHSDIKEKGKN